ncbi:MAG TPA: acetylxylan esterase [Longimicrobiaceae bacterium]
MSRSSLTRRWLVAALPCLLVVASAEAQLPVFTPDDSSGIYNPGERVGWTASQGTGRYRYTIRRDGGAVIDSGTIDLTRPGVRIETSLAQPGMVLVEIRPEKPDSSFGAPHTGGPGKLLLGAAVAPERIEAAEPEPADFDAFWRAKLAELEAVPMGAEVTPKESGVPGVEYATVRLNNIQGAHVYAQLARPSGDGPFPALVILQWASPPYPLQKSWVTDRAQQGWLVLNVEPHDVPVDMPQSFYDNLPTVVKRYEVLGDHSRDESHFLRMYLGDYRAVEFLTTLPQWDGETLVVMGTSMGGQQSFATAALHPRVTGMIAHVPAGADVTAALHGRAASYPQWNVEDPAVLETARYFDIVNFAGRIQVPALVSMGFIDELTRPTGIWAAFNRLRGPKEVVPLVDAPHNHMATEAQQQKYLDRAEAWLERMKRGEAPIAPGS